MEGGRCFNSTRIIVMIFLRLNQSEGKKNDAAYIKIVENFINYYDVPY